MKVTLLAPLIIGMACAQSATALEVDLCERDDQPGTGVNLSNAISVGGRVTFRCTGSAPLLLTRTHYPTRDTEIDGGPDRISLKVLTPLSSFIEVRNPHVVLRNLTIDGGGQLV